MKKLIAILFLLPTLVLAQSNLSQGGTGWATSVTGDLIVGTSSTLRYTRLPIGSTSQILAVSGGQPAWVATSTIFPSLSGFMTFLYASSTFPSFSYASSTYGIINASNGWTGAVNSFLGATFSNSTSSVFFSPSATFTSATSTSLKLSGALYDAANGAGSVGSILQSSGGSVVWAGTSTLGLVGLSYASSTFVPYIGATTKVDLGAQTLTSTGLITSTSSIHTNSTSTTFFGSNVFPNITGGSFVATDLTGKLIATSTPGSSLSGGVNGFLARWTSASALSTGLLRDNGTVVGVNATTSTSTFLVQGNSGTNDAFHVASSTGASMFVVKSTGQIGVSSSTPSNQITVATGSILVTEFVPNATSTSMTLNVTNSNTTLIKYGVANIVIGFSNYTAGQTWKVITCAPPSGTPGTVFFATTSPGVTWTAGSLPASTATVKKCDVWSFIATQGTSSSAISPAIFGAMTSNF